jgi:hypothetical protein
MAKKTEKKAKKYVSKDEGIVASVCGMLRAFFGRGWIQ